MKKQFLEKAVFTVAATAATVVLGNKMADADTYTLQEGDSFSVLLNDIIWMLMS